MLSYPIPIHNLINCRIENKTIELLKIDLLNSHLLEGFIQHNCFDFPRLNFLEVKIKNMLISTQEKILNLNEY